MSLTNFAELIDKSHKRSCSYCISKERLYPAQQLSHKEIQSLLNKNKDLLKIVEPFVLKLYDIVKGTGFFVNITDSEGCIIRIVGDEEIINDARKLKMIEGAYMSESSIGTNSMGIVVHDKRAVQVTASEHFVKAYHKWTCSAAPIMHNGELIATINMTGFIKNAHIHSLGMVIFASNAIENKLNEQEMLTKLETTNQFAFSMMNNLTFGVMAININDEIEWVNNTACRMVNIRRLKLVNREISEILTDWCRIKRIILNELLFLDEPSNFQIPHVKEKFLFNAYVIKGENNNMYGYLITFRQFSRVVNLIKKYGEYQTKFCFDSMFAVSSVMKKLKSTAIKVATKPTTILLSGESGTGKEVFAQSIHNASLCEGAPFIAINCGAISENLIESELFGYVDGAFTGARKGGAPGKFEIANHGTLFLDEIGEMSLEMQVKLLRSIQECKVTRIGGDHEIKLDVRIIAATNKDIKEEVKNGKFRLDLYYRLNVIHLQIPPLRERIADIMPMARFFASQKADKLRKPMARINMEFEKLLLNYNWPGNIRELENIMERFVVMDGDYSFMKKKADTQIYPSIAELCSVDVSDNSNKTLYEIEKSAILSCLKTNKNNISKTAKSLAISRNTLYKKLASY
ncbi:MAG: sigma-54-dependent Fis family transcriptional regulator [Bacteroidota bacterium]|nr:sigma-54-dependent Fis family transcriptional regulator [Bacteroidota bacterium]